MSPLLFLVLSVCAAALLGTARHLHARWRARSWRWLLAGPPLAAALALLVILAVTLLLQTSGVAAFFARAGLFVAALGLLGYGLRIYPHRPLIYLAAVPALLSLVLTIPRIAADTRAWVPLAAFDGLVALIALVDLGSLPRRRSLTIDREVGRVASLGKPHPVTLVMANYSGRPRTLWVRDGVPQELAAEPSEFHLRLAARSRATLSYHTRNARRGAFQLTTTHVRVRSRWGFWQRLLDYDVPSVVHVYPDMKQLSEYALLARTNRLSLMGVRRTRRIGQDHEFERLRDYTPDDNYRHIDWRSTARRRKLTVKDFQSNQSQRLIFLLDCGRMMTNLAGGLSLLDHALNSMLMLSYVALARGDAVGAICFSDEIHSFVPPAAGSRQMNRLLHAAFDRFPRLVESRYDQAFLYLANHCRKRTLVILITNLIDEVNANQVGQYLGAFSGKHLPLGVLLRDHQLFDAAESPDPRGEALFRAAAAVDIITWRSQVLADLESKGVLSLDLYPEDLAAPLINSYLEIKARHLL